MPKTATFEESSHYGGKAIVKFYPNSHIYKVTDSELGFKDQKMGGATSLTGTMNKGEGLMLYPMYEMKKYLKLWARANTIEDLLSSPLGWEDILKEGTRAHVKKSDRGKNVGTDAHSWVESYVRECIRVQEAQGITEPVNFSKMASFTCPEIPSVQEVKNILRQSYLDVFNASKPTAFDDYKKLPKLLFQDAETQEALWIEADMLHKSTTAARDWFARHAVFVHGTEDTVYSRKLRVCGKYDIDISVACSKDCDWCFRNGDQTVRDNILADDENYVFTGRYIADFKSTNASSVAPKGIYKEYLAQCGVYDAAKTEEFPDLKYDGHLILNGSKKDGSFNTHFSFERERNCKWATLLADLREYLYEAGKEIEISG